MGELQLMTAFSTSSSNEEGTESRDGVLGVVVAFHVLRVGGVDSSSGV